MPDTALQDAHTPYRDRALLALRELVPSLAEDRFWNQVARLGWSRGSCDARRLGADLACDLTLAECLGMLRRFRTLGEELQAAFDAWEARGGKPIDLGDDQLQDLREHLVGLGRESYGAALRDPSLAQRRAEEGDFRESFGLVFLEALDRYTDRALGELLSSYAHPFPSDGALNEGEVVRHPHHGLGVVVEEEWAFRFRVSFPEGDLFVDRRPELLN